MSLYRVACKVSGGSTGTRNSYLKHDGQTRIFYSYAEAEDAAAKAREAVYGHNGPARFAYWVEQIGGVP